MLCCRRRGRVSNYFQADDTSAAALGKEAYTTVIANPLFASFNHQREQSRVKLLEVVACAAREIRVGRGCLKTRNLKGFPWRCGRGWPARRRGGDVRTFPATRLGTDN